MIDGLQCTQVGDNVLAISDIVARVRLEIGDPLQPFRSSALGDGQTVWYDLPNQQLSTLTVSVVNGASYTPYTDYSDALSWSASISYAAGKQVTYNNLFLTALQNSTAQVPVQGGNSYWRDDTTIAYIVNDQLGQVQLGYPPVNKSTVVMSGTAWSLFSDDELTTYCTDAVNEHCFNRKVTERFYDTFGRITFRETPVNLSNLPSIEEPLVSALAVINTFYVLANDTATDFNVQTAEGTNINRTAQYNQIINQINIMQARYKDYCAQLNVGLYRTEVMELRRQSYTTGRLVPLFASQEYDDHRWPTRELPPIDTRNEDNSGLPSPLWGQMGGV